MEDLAGVIWTFFCGALWMLLSFNPLDSIFFFSRRIEIGGCFKLSHSVVDPNTVYIEFGCGSRILAQLGSGSRVIVIKLKNIKLKIIKIFFNEFR